MLRVSFWTALLVLGGSWNAVDSKSRINHFIRQKLLNNIDGIGLKDANKFPSAHRWISDGTSFLSERDFIGCVQTRIAAVPCRSRLASGRVRDRACSAGCSVVESANHIIQRCHRTHGFRIERHNAVLHYIARGLLSRSEQVLL